MHHRAALLFLLIATSLVAVEMEPLVTALPKPLVVGTPVPIKVENLEPTQTGKVPPFLVPKGATNLALKRPVTSSDAQPLLGEVVERMETLLARGGHRGQGPRADRRWLEAGLAALAGRGATQPVRPAAGSGMSGGPPARGAGPRRRPARRSG